MFEKYSHLESLIQNINSSQHKQTKGLDERIRKLEKKVFSSIKKHPNKFEDHINNEN